LQILRRTTTGTG